jgi:hypothetical protein
MPGFDSGFAPRVKAVLGPTNTGKTHLAIERMLAHASGIIGFPCAFWLARTTTAWSRSRAPDTSR